MQHNALCIQGMVERIRTAQRANRRGCSDLADSPSCLYFLAQRQTLGGLRGGGAAGSRAPSSLGQQRVRLPPTPISSARPRRPPEERLGAAVGLGIAHPARAPRISRPGGHRTGHSRGLETVAGTRRARRPVSSVLGPAGLAERAPAPAPPLRLAPPPGQSPRARRPARALRPAAAPAAAATAAAERFSAAPGFQLRAGTGSVGGGAGGGQETENAAEPGAGSRSHSLDQNLAASCAAVSGGRLPSPPRTATAASSATVVRGLWVSGLKVGPDVGAARLPDRPGGCGRRRRRRLVASVRRFVH